MADLESQWRSMVDDAVRFFDTWNVLGAVGIVIIVAISFAVGGFTPQSVLVTVTAFYAYIAFNQMRESRWNRRPVSSLVVRPHFPRKHNGETFDFGLRNFGDSPALNLRIKAILREGNEDVATRTISTSNRHLHLEEGEFLSLIAESSADESFGDLTDTDAPVFENYEEKSIELYYTFESNNGVQYPRDWDSPLEMEMDEVVEKAKTPRTVELAEMREKCT